MHPLLDLHAFEGDEQLAVDVPQAAEHGRDTHEVDVGRELLRPGIESRFELVAVRAAVPEQLHHLDLARDGHRNRAAQLDVLLAGLDVFSLDGAHAQQAGTGENGGKYQVTHASLLDGK
ncbi:hypothetical protein D3C76_1324380 [compost metagenome]